MDYFTDALRLKVRIELGMLFIIVGFWSGVDVQLMALLTTVWELVCQAEKIA